MRPEPKRSIYLDYNATTPVDIRVIGKMEHCMRNNWGNPSSLHIHGAQADKITTEAEQVLHSYFQDRGNLLHFCSSGSEAVYAGIYGLWTQGNCHLISTNIEHASIQNSIRLLRALGSKAITVLSVDRNGQVDLAELTESAGKRGTPVFVYSPVNHETGALQQIEEIYSIIKAAEGIVFIDGVQAAARLEPSAWVPYCDMFTISGHKIYGPKGIGALSVKKDIDLIPFRSSEQENLFPGTVNLQGIAGITKAVEILSEELKDDLKEQKVLIDELIRLLTKQKVPYFLESPEMRAPGIACLSFPDITNIEDFMFHLSRDQISVSRFSACTKSIEGASGILLNMHREKNRAETSIRVSLGRQSKREDILRFVSSVEQALTKTSGKPPV
ncbi:MAG: cysteine desulfurase family protein [Spirochaetia bacterium]